MPGCSSLAFAIQRKAVSRTEAHMDYGTLAYYPAFSRSRGGRTVMGEQCDRAQAA